MPLRGARFGPHGIKIFPMTIQMDPRSSAPPAGLAPARPYDARLARWLVTPLQHTCITPNHLTSLRLLIGTACALAFSEGSYGFNNLGAWLVLSNFVDHTDGELARISGKTSRLGHFYDLASDGFVTVALFVGISIGVGAVQGPYLLDDLPLTAASLLVSAPTLGWLAGIAVALMFVLRLQIEERMGKAGTQQASVGGFETEDILYLMPLVTLLDGTQAFLVAAAIGAPLFALWVVWDYWRGLRLPHVARANRPEGAQ